MIKKGKYIVLFFMIAHIAYAQNYINYNENNGLPSNHIFRITQDANGFIWIGTNKGLVKYDGKKFTTFTTTDGLQSNSIWNMVPTSDGKLWFLSKTSKIGYIKNDSIHTFASNIKDDVFNPLYTGIIKDSIFPNGPHKSFAFDAKNKYWKRLENKINSKNNNTGICLKHKKWDIIGYDSQKKGFVLIDQHQRDTFQLKLNNIIQEFNIRHQLTDSLFLLLNSKKYIVVNLNTLKVHEKKFKDEIGIEFTQNVCANYVNNGIQISGNKFVGKLNENYGLSDVTYIDKNLNTNNIFIDKQQTLWIATFSNGVYKLPKITQKTSYYFHDNEVPRLRKVGKDIIALVQKKGFYKYDEKEKKFIPFLKNHSFLYNCGHIPSLKMSYYLGVKMSAITNKKKRLKYLKYSTEINDYLRSMIYCNNSFYAHSGFGIYKIAIKDSLHLIKNYQQIGTNYITQFKNHIFVATNSGLKHIKNDTLTATKVTYTKKIKGIFPLSESKLLMTTDGDGAFITDLISTTQIPETQNLIVSDAFQDGNKLWLATNEGVQEYRIKDDACFFLRTIDKRYGLPTNKTNSVITTDDRILIATNLGIINLPIKHLYELELLDIYIKDIFFNTKKITSNSKVLYSKDNTFEVEMGVVDFSEDTKPIQYAYKLEPIHKEWHTTNLSKLNFNNLPPNHYTLLIKVKNIIKSTSFVIEPQWYQTWMFYLLMTTLFAVSITFITAHISRLIQKRKNKELHQLKKLSELELKALRSQMNPHFVFNSLMAIQYYMNQNDFESSDRYLVKFSRLIRDFFELSKEQVISIEREERLLTNYLELEVMRFKGKLSYQIKVDPELDIKAKIPSMLLQPIVENAVNHGIFNKESKGNVNILFEKINNNTISISISDDGVGIKKNQKNQKRLKSTSVLTDRIQFLNDTKEWFVKIKCKDLYENQENKGHLVIFTITQIL